MGAGGDAREHQMGEGLEIKRIPLTLVGGMLYYSCQQDEQPNHWSQDERDAHDEPHPR